jgi:outer membrane protein OmpA-like peptidoglycan-associated protein
MKPLEKVKVILKSSADSIAILSNAAGVFNANLKSETDYKLTYYKPGYFSATGFVSTKGKRNQDSTYIYLNTLAELDKIFTQKEIVIPNIYYDYNKATLRPESKIVLDSILIFFNSNKELIIEIGSHTDSRGGDAYNEKLSQARAQSVVDYLIEKGIEKDRLAAKGYGEARLVNNCANDVNCTEEEHQKNRRTTFRITGSKQIIQSIEPEDVNTVPKD